MAPAREEDDDDEEEEANETWSSRSRRERQRTTTSTYTTSFADSDGYEFYYNVVHGGGDNNHDDDDVLLTALMGGDLDNKKVSKLGRKGDARMHRAVAARLANPDLSLFEALRIGGFDFPTDDDASIMDSEQVTLGQRKNQLSRRLRLARQTDKDTTTATTTTPTRSNKQQDQDSISIGSQSNPQRHGGNIRLGGSKRGSSSTISNAMTEDEVYDEEEEKVKKMAKYHPQFHPMHIRSGRNVSSGALQASAMAAAAAAAQQHQAAAVAAAAAAGPSFHQAAAAAAAALYSRASFLGTPPSSSVAAAAAHHFHHHQHQQHSHQSQQQHHPSGVAIASLTTTAQSVGYTLEQLAVALSSSSNLVRVLANPNSNRKQEMSLNLFRSEVSALYARCMLLAGYGPEEAAEGSSEHLQFALKAWEMESKRLGFLMERNHTTAPLATSTTTQQQQQPSSSSSGAAASQPRSPPPRSLARRSARPSPATGGDAAAGVMAKERSVKTSTVPLNQQNRSIRDRVVEEDDDDMDDDVDDDRNANEDNGKDEEEEEEEDCHHRHHQHTHGQNKNNNHHQHHCQQHNHHHDHEDVESVGSNESSSGNNDNKHNCFDGRHVHRLEGQCGHRAIIHLPKDGTAHIDFVVNDKVECYHGIAPIGMENKAVSLWPSQYKCEDLDCPTPCGQQLCDHSQNWGQGSHSTAPANPRLLEISALDFDGSEWNAESTEQIDETLLGLFQLGAPELTTTTTNTSTTSAGTAGASTNKTH